MPLSLSLKTVRRTERSPFHLSEPSEGEFAEGQRSEPKTVGAKASGCPFFSFPFSSKPFRKRLERKRPPPIPSRVYGAVGVFLCSSFLVKKAWFGQAKKRKDKER